MGSERKIIAEKLRRVLLKEYVSKVVERAGLGGVDIQRTPIGTRVTLVTEKPGLIIGTGGGAIKELTESVARKFKFDNPQIEVQEVSNVNLNAQIMAQKLASALERGWHFRRAAYSTLTRIMDAGAKGCQVVISGKLTGRRHRTAKFTAGNIKYCGETAEQFMSIGYAIAKTKPGVLGVKIKIMDPNAKLPDEIMIRVKEEKAVEIKEGNLEMAEPKPELKKEGEAEAKE